MIRMKGIRKEDRMGDSVLAALDVDASTAQAITDSYAEARQRIADTLIPPNR